MYPDKMSTQKSKVSLINRYIKYRRKEDFALIYREYVDDLYRFLLSKTNNPTTSQEVVSDTFFVLIDLIDKYDSKKSKFKTFLFGIGLNKLRQRWDKERSSKSFSLNEEIALDSEYLPRKDGKKLFKQILLVMKKLSDKYRRVITLRFIENLSIKEVAQRLNISATNVTTIQNRAIDKIRKLIDEKK